MQPETLVGALSWTQLLGLALGSGLTVKLLDIAYETLRSHSSRKQSSRTVVERHPDPILKAADEVVGKIRALAEEDFGSLIHAARPAQQQLEYRALVLLYLFASLWARIELLRRDAIAVSLQAHPKGRRLKQFLDCMESRRVRLVDRAMQRAIGETLIDSSASPAETIFFVEFARRVEGREVWSWYEPLYTVTTRMSHTQERQRLLQYGAVLHALIDTLDPKHHVTGNRPGWPNKLTKRSRRALRFRVFAVYLPFVRTKEKYAGE